MLRKVLIGVAALLVALVGIGFLLPGTTKISEEVVINAPADQVYATLNSLEEFNAWSPWAKMEPSAAYSFSGPSSGVGAAMSWDGKQVGKGEQSIVSSTPERIDLALKFGGATGHKTWYEIKPEGEATRVVWAYESAPYGINIFGRYVGALAMKSALGKSYQDGLADLKAYVESKPAGQASATGGSDGTPVAGLAATDGEPGSPIGTALDMVGGAVDAASDTLAATGEALNEGLAVAGQTASDTAMIAGGTAGDIADAASGVADAMGEGLSETAEMAETAVAGLAPGATLPEGFKAEIVTVAAQPIVYLTSEANVGTPAGSQAIGEAFAKLSAFVAANKLETAGAPIAITNSFDATAKLWKFDAALVLKSAPASLPASSEGIKLGSSYAGKVLKVAHKGSLDTEPTYYATQGYLETNNLKVIDRSWEEYVTPMTGPAENAAVNIYFPVQ